jgi:hypothetical protein
MINFTSEQFKKVSLKLHPRLLLKKEKHRTFYRTFETQFLVRNGKQKRPKKWTFHRTFFRTFFPVRDRCHATLPIRTFQKWTFGGQRSNRTFFRTFFRTFSPCGNRVNGAVASTDLYVTGTESGVHKVYHSLGPYSWQSQFVTLSTMCKVKEKTMNIWKANSNSCTDTK